MAALIGLLHDLGKATRAFQAYLLGAAEHPKHSVYGARYAYETWFKGDDAAKRTAVIIALCICGHHAGFQDVLNHDGESPFLDGLTDCDPELYAEAKARFLKQIVDADTLNSMFRSACREVDTFLNECAAWKYAMLSRLLLSFLVDADRWDSACFEYGTDLLSEAGESVPPWASLLAQLESYLGRFSACDDLSRIRRSVSERCKAAAQWPGGVYTLSVPTGGGKTYTGLRYALIHAAENLKKRIFYIIPFNTILDQNAGDIREALDNYPSILEHHANVVTDAADDEQAALHCRLTERWDSDIILTSLVQFLNAFYRKENSDARRMWRLSDSVLIFDEVQSVPTHCRQLFVRAVRFLCECCGCTALLCTATQPRLPFKVMPREIMENVPQLYERLRRVRYLPDLTPRRCDQLAGEIAPWLSAGRATLAIVNTKPAALELFIEIQQRLRAADIPLVEIRCGMTDNELAAYAAGAEDSILCVHLSTSMCPAHRKEILRCILAWQGAKKTLCCVSTALIEAGINVSFPLVVRSLAGLSSLIQAAGRCNRNGEAATGDVLIRFLKEENLSMLREIQLGQDISRELIRECEETGGGPGRAGVHFGILSPGSGKKLGEIVEHEADQERRKDPGRLCQGCLRNLV